MHARMRRRRILVIAGSDSSGGAGLEADQKVIAAHGCYAMTATTALTAQNTQRVHDIHVTPAAFVQKQIKACTDDIGVDVIKTGMLASTETIKVVAESLRSLEQLPLCVVDPVMVSTSGSQLLPQEAVKTLRELLLPLTTILTPNYDEARLFLQDAGVEIPKVEDIHGLEQTARAVQRLGPQNVLLKGGHMPLTKARITPTSEDDQKHVVVDILVGSNGDVEVFETDYIDSKQTHGTGCSLASAIASNLASGLSMSKAVKAASQYVSAGIRTAPGLGKGSGPIDHFHSSYKLPFAPGHFIEYLLDREDVAGLWRQHTHHHFVKELAKGTLPIETFKYYLIQDYLYLVQFARANALAAYKAQDMEDIAMSASLVTHIQNEMNLHISYCATFGVSLSTLKSTEESQACTAYTRYMLDVGHSEDWLALQISFAPCLLGYGEIARRLIDDPETKVEGNVYYEWIKTYDADDYVEAVRKGREMLEKHAIKQSPRRIEELVKIFSHATKMEIGFWEMGSSPEKVEVL